MKIKFLLQVICGLLAVFVLSACVDTTHKQMRKQRVISGVGEAHMAKGNFSSALKYFLDAEAVYANDHLLQDNLGKVYVAKEKYGLAIKHFKKSLVIKPDFAPGKNNLGSAYLLAGKWDDAIKVFEDLSSDLLYATPQYPMYNLGWAYYNKKDYKRAIKYFKKALKIDRSYVQALRGLGLTYKKQGRVKLAEKYLKKAAIKAPKFQQLQFELANVYVVRKKYNKALEAFNDVVRLEPDSELAEIAQEKITKLEKL